MTRSRWDGQVRTSRSQRGRRFSQDSTRHGLTLYDQHDRAWSATAENKSGAPTGSITPMFKAPWYPDQQYLRVNPDNASELHIDYKSMYRDFRSDLDDYHAKVVKACMASDWKVPDKGGPYPPRVIAACGYPSKPLEPILAAHQGNPWILGFATKPDPRLVEFVKRRENELESATRVDFGAESYQSALGGAEAEAVLADGPPEEPPEVEGRGLEDISDPNLDPEDTDLDLTPPTDFEGTDEEERLLDTALDIEEDADAEAMGGRTIDPRTTDRAERQAPRRPTQTAVPRKHGAQRSAQGQKGKGARALPKRPKGDKRPTLADGARPVVGHGEGQDYTGKGE